MLTLVPLHNGGGEKEEWTVWGSWSTSLLRACTCGVQYAQLRRGAAGPGGHQQERKREGEDEQRTNAIVPMMMGTYLDEEEDEALYPEALYPGWQSS